MLGGLAGFAWGTVDSDVIVIAMVATGIAVDDTIHFVTCFLSESSKTNDAAVAIERSFHLAGRSMVKSTLILCLGFAPFALSGYSTTRHMGTLLPFTLFVAMLCDLFLTPALARVRILRG
jgi:predicted RND superfamily exporter protein